MSFRPLYFLINSDIILLIMNNNLNTITNILQFWFRGVTDETRINRGNEPYRSWFQKNDEFDRSIKEQFEDYIVAAEKGHLKNWEDTIEGRLALILLLDQFPRNIYRNTPEAFKRDPITYQLVSDTISKDLDKTTLCIYRVFIYMPLMHQEDLQVQELGVRKFEELITDSEQCCPKITHYFKYNLDFAKRHRDIIARFGRFPHRNKILERESTSKEIEFLTTPGSEF